MTEIFLTANTPNEKLFFPSDAHIHIVARLRIAPCMENQIVMKFHISSSTGIKLFQMLSEPVMTHEEYLEIRERIDAGTLFEGGYLLSAVVETTNLEHPITYPNCNSFLIRNTAREKRQDQGELSEESGREYLQ